MIAHLEEKSGRCKDVVLQLPDLSQHVVDELDTADSVMARAFKRTGRSRVAGDLPSYRAYGPMLKEAFAAGIDWKYRLRTATCRHYPV